ncbi:MAG: type II secretion system protein [bacterium]
MRNEKGFTLIELLVVIAIIGLLSTLAVVSLSTARVKARDVKRQADAKTLQSAIEMFITDSPTGLAPTKLAAWPGTLTTELATYMPGGVPQDPGLKTWCYCSNGANKYLIAVGLEQDMEIAGDLDSAPTSYTLASDCYCSTPAVPAVGMSCADSDGGQVGEAVTTTALCLGAL